MRHLTAEVQRLSEQVRRDEDEFAMVSAALDAKERALADALSELDRTRDREALLCLQLKEQPRRRSTVTSASSSSSFSLSPVKTAPSAKPTVEFADACLSPRSFRENALIALRDDAIAAKTREVWLLSGQNDQLRAQLDELEGALERVQTALMHREHDAVRSQRTVDALQAEVEALRTMRSQAEGRERAMAIAAAQNAKLLQALAAQEKQTESVAEKLDEATRENEHPRKRIEAQLATMATSTSTTESNELIAAMRKEIAGLYDKLQREWKREQGELTELRLKQQLEVDRLESELVMRRTRQYELTRELQDAQGDLHDAVDARDTAVEQLAASQARMRELENLLSESLARIASLERQLSDALAMRSELEAQTQKRQEDAEKEIAVLKKQLEELNESLRSAIRREKQRERDHLERGEVMGLMESVHREQRERIARLAEQVTRESQQRTELALEKQVIADQLEEVKRQFERGFSEWTALKQQLEARVAQTRDQSRDLQRELDQALDGKSALTVRVADAVRVASGTGGAAKGPASVLTSLGLDGCALEDRDAAPLLSTLLSLAPPSLRSLDLRGNRLTADSARTFASFAQQVIMNKKRAGGDGGLCEIDLQQNFISLDGVREVASGLEALVSGSSATSNNANTVSAWLSSVVVSSSGRIECFADGDQPQRKAFDRSTAFPVLVIDISANLDAEAMVTEARKLQMAHRHRQRLDDAPRSTARGSNGNSSVVSLSASALQEIYGADLVGAAFDGSPAPKPTGRRKSNPLEPLAPSASPRTSLMSPAVSNTRSSPQLPLVPVSDRSTPREEDEDDASAARAPVASASTVSLPRLEGR